MGELSVKEKTTKDLENDIKKLLVDGGYLINPNVTVRLLNAKVTILGEVNTLAPFLLQKIILVFAGTWPRWRSYH